MPLLARRRFDTDTLLDDAVKSARDPRLLDSFQGRRRVEVEKLMKAVQAGAARPSHVTAQSLQNQTGVSAPTVAARAHSALGPSSQITPAEIQLALQRQGLDFIEPFAPGTPLTPFYGFSRRPRNYDYRVGRNITTETRPDRIPYTTLKQLFDAYDVARICTRHALNDLRSMRIRFEAIEGYQGKNPTKAIEQAKTFWRRPDKVLSFPNWLVKYGMDVWRYDAGTLFKQRDRAGNVIALKVVDGTTVLPLLDYFGDQPSGDAPAFEQFIQGVPWDWLEAKNMVYEPMWPEPESPFGTPPLETVLVNANCFSDDT
jgi:hypothetical protein